MISSNAERPSPRFAVLSRIPLMADVNPPPCCDSLWSVNAEASLCNSKATTSRLAELLPTCFVEQMPRFDQTFVHAHRRLRANNLAARSQMVRTQDDATMNLAEHFIYYGYRRRCYLAIYLLALYSFPASKAFSSCSIKYSKNAVNDGHSSCGYWNFL